MKFKDQEKRAKCFLKITDFMQSQVKFWDYMKSQSNLAITRILWFFMDYMQSLHRFPVAYICTTQTHASILLSLYRVWTIYSLLKAIVQHRDTVLTGTHAMFIFFNEVAICTDSRKNGENMIFVRLDKNINFLGYIRWL